MTEAKYWHIWNIYVWNFKDTLTNDVISFEQPGPDLFLGQNICCDNSLPFR